ncbi:MAG: hypothetical protein JWM10_5206 [Myxococcaceae bacterium]|nr:hypothetical protein [Myxococcaceae bacterium]
MGLTVEILRRRGASRWGAPLLAAFGVAAAIAAITRTREEVRATNPTAELRAWRTAPCDQALAFIDPAVVAAGDGWIVAWTRWERAGSPRVQLAALGRDGALRGEVRTVSNTGSFARRPSLARDGARVGVAWTAAQDEDRWPPHPWMAVVDANATVTVPAVAVAPTEEAFDVHLASDGQGWGVGWLSFSAAHRGFALARLTPGGAPRGPVTHVEHRAGGVGADLAWTGDAWLAPQVSYDFARDRGALQLHWIDRGGRLVETQRFAPSRGEIGPVHVAARGGAAWLTWGEDSGFNLRHDPRLARLEGRRAVVGPVSLGPRRSSAVAELACAATGCLAAWVGVAEEGDEPAALHVQALDADGAHRGAARRLGPPALLTRLGGAAVARSVDERESLAVWTVRDGDAWQLMRARLGPDGAPLAPPALHPLP